MTSSDARLAVYNAALDAVLERRVALHAAHTRAYELSVQELTAAGAIA